MCAWQDAAYAKERSLLGQSVHGVVGHSQSGYATDASATWQSGERPHILLLSHILAIFAVTLTVSEVTFVTLQTVGPRRHRASNVAALTIVLNEQKIIS